MHIGISVASWLVAVRGLYCADGLLRNTHCLWFKYQLLVTLMPIHNTAESEIHCTWKPTTWTVTKLIRWGIQIKSKSFSNFWPPNSHRDHCHFYMLTELSDPWLQYCWHICNSFPLLCEQIIKRKDRSPNFGVEPIPFYAIWLQCRDCRLILLASGILIL